MATPKPMAAKRPIRIIVCSDYQSWASALYEAERKETAGSASKHSQVKQSVSRTAHESEESKPSILFPLQQKTRRGPVSNRL